MTQSIHEIQDQFDVQTPLGYGTALFLIAGSMHANPGFIVRLYESGELRTVDQNDVKVYGNPMTGNGWDLAPNKSKGNKSNNDGKYNNRNK
jgi:hypothetical protein